MPGKGFADLLQDTLRTIRILNRQRWISGRLPFLAAAFVLGLLVAIPLLGFAFRHSDLPRATTPASGPALFQDIPLDHPLYRAWKPLLKAGAPVADRDEASRPYEPILWEDWNRVVGHSFQQLVPELEVQQILPLHRKGPMHPQDLKSEMMELGRLLELRKVDTYLPAVSSETPSRLEAFAALARLFTEAGR